MAEHRIVVPGVVGSSPIFHPIFIETDSIESVFFCL
jgi:hypothetical protein